MTRPSGQAPPHHVGERPAVEVARFEHWEPAGAAQAARVLRPAGRLTIFGHAVLHA